MAPEPAIPAEFQSSAPTPSPLPLATLRVIPPDQEAQALIDRMNLWNSSLKPWDEYELWLEQGVGQTTLHTDRIHQQEILLRHAQAQRAQLYWDYDRRADVEALAAGLMRHPALIITRLRRTRHGCELLAEHWEILQATAEARGVWSEPNRLLAMNLLGIPPELRDAVTPLDTPPNVDPKTHLIALAKAQAQRHRDLAATLTPIDATERAAAMAGLAPATPELKELRKEARGVDRRLGWYRSQFKTSRPTPRPIDRGDLPAYIPGEFPITPVKPMIRDEPRRSRKKDPKSSNPEDPPSLLKA